MLSIVRIWLLIIFACFAANTGTAKEHQGCDDYCWFWPCDRGSSDESTHSEGE